MLIDYCYGPTVGIVWDFLVRDQARAYVFCSPISSSTKMMSTLVFCAASACRGFISKLQLLYKEFRLKLDAGQYNLE